MTVHFPEPHSCSARQSMESLTEPLATGVGCRGVMVTHQGVRNLVHAFRPMLAVDAPDVRSQVAPMTFDLHAMDVYCAFDVGASVAICDKDELLTDLNGFIKRRGVKGIVCTPTVASLLDPAKCPSLCWLALGGEMLPRALVKKWINAGELCAKGLSSVD